MADVNFLQQELVNLDYSLSFQPAGSQGYDYYKALRDAKAAELAAAQVGGVVTILPAPLLPFQPQPSIPPWLIWGGVAVAAWYLMK